MSLKGAAAESFHAGARVAFRRAINPTMLRALQTPRGAARLGGSLVGLRYTGHRSGDQHVLVVGYVRDADRLVSYAGFGKHKVWWRNFRRSAPVEVLLDGTWKPARARTLCSGDPGRDSAAELLRRVRPRQRIGDEEPIVEIRLDSSSSQASIAAAEQTPAAAETDLP